MGDGGWQETVPIGLLAEVRVGGEIVVDDQYLVPGEDDVQFQRVHSVLQGKDETWQGVLRCKASGSAVSLEINGYGHRLGPEGAPTMERAESGEKKKTSVGHERVLLPASATLAGGEGSGLRPL